MVSLYVFLWIKDSLDKNKRNKSEPSTTGSRAEGATECLANHLAEVDALVGAMYGSLVGAMYGFFEEPVQQEFQFVQSMGVGLLTKLSFNVKNLLYLSLSLFYI